MKAQVMHTVVFCDTNDSKIGSSVCKDHDNMVRELGDYACFIDYDNFCYDYSGDECNKKNLLQTISELEIAPKDIVVFFYSGHGTRAFNNENDPLPQMCLGSSFDNEFVPLQYIINNIKGKKPKLLVAITNCCNKEQDGVSIKPLLSQAMGATSLSKINTDAYKKLFSEVSGEVVITSSQAGEYSWCSSDVGGLFIVDFLDVMYQVGTGQIQPDWHSVFENAKAKTSVRQINTSTAPYTATQTPYYRISLNKENEENNDNPINPDLTERDNKDNSDLKKETDLLAHNLNDLVDNSLTMDDRLALIPVILKKYFSNNAKIRTLGRNGMTVDYEYASDFLRRVALSNRITKITIVNKDPLEKHKEISIHEIHK